jgi:glycosyltransferase involved in cell wall biosynthesis
MKSILILAPYDNIYPPMNGGMQRCFHIINQLAKYFDLTAIIHQDKKCFLKASTFYPAISSIKIYSTNEEKAPKDIFKILPGNLENSLRYKWIRKQLTSPANGSFLQYYPVLKRVLKMNHFDAIILENLFTINAVSTIRKLAKKTTIIYDAHNVDTHLALGSEHLKGIRKTESGLYKTVDAIFSCSEKDKSDFLKMNKNRLRVAVIPNGVSIGEMCNELILSKRPEFILFCGSLSSIPNSEGLLWFYEKMWPRVRELFPELKLLIVGSGKLPYGFDHLVLDSSIMFAGSVDEVKPFYNKATVAVVPLLNGSGTRLKILEAMNFGLPVISTSIGAEGIDCTDGKDIVIANKEIEFAEKLIELLSNEGKQVIMSKAGKDLVKKKYDWNIIGRTMYDFINRLTEE